MERTQFPAGPVSPTKLFAFNDSVDAYNARALEQLPAGDTVEFRARDEGVEPHLRQLQKNCQAPAVLVLRPGAQVMLLKNLDVEAGLVNGTRGVVEDFVDRSVDEDGRIVEDGRINEDSKINEDGRIIEDRKIVEDRKITEDRKIIEERKIVEDRKIIEDRKIVEDGEENGLNWEVWKRGT